MQERAEYVMYCSLEYILTMAFSDYFELDSLEGRGTCRCIVLVQMHTNSPLVGAISIPVKDPELVCVSARRHDFPTACSWTPVTANTA